jgi:predicted enzyme related to lactoylglutathione lyase
MSNAKFLDIVPRFAVPDVAAAVAYYQDVLGFWLVNSLGEPPVFAIVGRNGVEIHLSNQGTIPGPGKDAWHVYIHVTGLDALIKEFGKSGAKMVSGPTTRPYGMREIVVEGPFGFCLAFGEAVS